jgi:hypothetical protein
MWGRNLRGLDEVNRVVPKLDPQLGFALHVRPERVRALTLTTDCAGKAAGSLRLVDPGLGALVSVIAVSPFGRVAAELGKAGTDGSQPFELDLPVGVAVGWEFRAVDVHGREHRVGWPMEAEHGFRIGGDVRDACWQRTITGYCNLLTDAAVAEAHSAALAADELSIELGLIGLELADCADARLVGRFADVPVRRVEPVDQTVGELGVRGVRMVFPLVAARWGGPELPLPSDDYRVVPARAYGCCAPTG